MRTTIDLNDELFQQVKRRAVRERITLRAFIERALRAHLGSAPRQARYVLRWRTEHGHGPSRVPVEDRDALFDLMDGR